MAEGADFLLVGNVYPTPDAIPAGRGAGLGLVRARPRRSAGR